MNNNNYMRALNILGLLKTGNALQQAVYQQITMPAGLHNAFQSALQEGSRDPYWMTQESTETLTELTEHLDVK